MKTIAVQSPHRVKAHPALFCVQLGLSLASQGHRVCIVEYNLTTPDLYSHFSEETDKKFINQYFRGKTDDADNYFTTITSPDVPEVQLEAGFADPDKNATRDVLNWNSQDSINSLRQLLRLQQKTKNMGVEYLLIVTNKGLSMWFINSISISDVLVKIMPVGEAWIDGLYQTLRATLDTINPTVQLVCNGPVSTSDKEKYEAQIQERFKKMPERRVEVLGWILWDWDVIEGDIDGLATRLANFE